jgi:hypothetical protein
MRYYGAGCNIGLLRNSLACRKALNHHIVPPPERMRPSSD